ncbi:hypothetical protein Tsubulata_000865 [Turnera subulata]|uniref:BSD domain-containing protein n=1 Tax=Turnera subulata TaxID=218843 RepID=A0A9Q0G8K3_9ROSI|nr:hypothetical protein Tsubulata_000865 [Turnera subulata]
MSWLARSIANSLRLDDDGANDAPVDRSNTNRSDNNSSLDSKSPPPKPESDQQPSQSSSPSSSSTTATPRGVKEDLTDLTKTLTRQFWGVASFLAPPPPSSSSQASSSPPISPSPPPPTDPEEDEADALIAGIRSDFAEIGGKFRSGISKLSSHKTVSEFTKIASNLLQQIGSDPDYTHGDAVGVTEEVVAFARDVAMHPETWLDFPIPNEEDFEDFDMSDAQQEHALAVERLAPRLAALRMELCPGYMSDGCFWKIYFVLVHPRLTKQDAELLSTPQIVEAREMLSQGLKNKATAVPKPSLSASGSDTEISAALPSPESLSVPSRAEPEPQLDTPKVEVVSPYIAASGNEAVATGVAVDLEMDKHSVESTEVQIIDKAVVEEEHINQTKHQYASSSSSSKVLDEKFEDDADDWLKEDTSEMVGTSRTSMPLGNDEDVSFSDLEDDDGDVPTSYKKAGSGSDSSAKDPRDWVQLSRSSSDSVKHINPVDAKHGGSEQVSARNSETKESNDWLDIDDIEVM